MWHIKLSIRGIKIEALFYLLDSENIAFLSAVSIERPSLLSYSSNNNLSFLHVEIRMC